LSTAYGAFQNLTPTVTNHAPVFGNGETITAGIYSVGSAGAIAGTLTLDGQNNPNSKFIFQIGGALNSSAGSTIVLTNGATPNNISWVVLNACGLGANTTFFGTIMAGAAIAAGDNCQIQGKLLSVAGAIAINHTCLSNNESAMFYADADHDGFGNPNISSCIFIAGYVNNDKDCSDNNATFNPGVAEIWGNYIDENCDGIIFRPQEQCLPSVGMASEFTLFTGAGAITQSATVSNITGNIGTNSGVISGFQLSNVTGSFINANLITQTAKQDLISAYTMFQNLAPTVLYHAPAFGNGETLTAGIYSIGGAGSIAGVLVLDGQNNCENKFVFKFGGAFTTGAGSSVILINGALPKNIYWIANGAAGLAANVAFNGTIINNAALSIGAECQLNGKLYTTTGAITVLGSNLFNSGPIQNTFYSDNDNDGYGDASISVLDCNCSLIGFTLDGNDCDDTNPSIHPNAIEIYGNGIDDNCNSIVDNDAVTCSFTTTWDGVSWNPFLPVENQHAVIAGNYSQSTDLESCSLDIINNAIVSIPSGFDLIVAGKLNVQSGSLTIQNNANLLQSGTTNVNSGEITSKRINSSMRRLDYTYWSSPTTKADYSLKMFSPMTISLSSLPSGGVTGASRFYYLKETTNVFAAVEPTTTYFDDANIARGWMIRAPNNFPTNGTTATFNANWIGKPNNGNITLPVTFSGVDNGFNLIGNPYPSPIDVMSFLQYSPDNGLTRPNAGTIYLWAHHNQGSGINNYACCNLSGSTMANAVFFSDTEAMIAATPNGKIQVGQGFILKKAAASTVVFNNSMRAGNNEGQFFKTATIERNRIWLNLAVDTTPLNQIMVGYIEGTTLGYDDSYDGKLINDASSISSIIDNENYVIQARPTPFVTTDEVPLNFKADTAQSYTLSIDHVDGLFLGEQNVYLKDNLLNVTHDIKASAYTFTSDQGTFNNRFEVVYINSTLNISTPTFDANSVIVYKDDNKVLNINAGKVVMKNVKIYDVRGRLVYEKSNINSTTTALKDLKAEQEVLLVKITSDDNKVVTKKVVF
jgi:hypothetical protein